MGLFNYFYSSFDLGPNFTNVLCQTKTLGIECMDYYWLDPAGGLFRVDYEPTRQMEIIEEGDPRYDPGRPFLNYEMVGTGERGKVEPVYLTCYAEVYWDRFPGEWEHWPTMQLHFRHGRLMDFMETTGQ